MLQVTVTVPSESAGRTLDAGMRQAALEKVLAGLSGMFGGATSTEGQGAWVNGAGTLVRENVTLASSFAEDAAVNDKWQDVKALAGWLKDSLAQESVLVSVTKVERVEWL